MNYKKMWYELKQQMLDSNNRGLTNDAVIKRMSRLEVSEALKEFKPYIKSIDTEMIIPDKLPHEIAIELRRTVKNWDSSL